MNKIVTRIFVYGTLKNGFPNHYLLENTQPNSGKAIFLEYGQTKESYPLVIGTDANIPFMLPFPGKGLCIKGEVFEVDEEALGHLDVLEEHPTWYRRLPCRVVLSDSNEIDCEAYFLMNCKKELLDAKFYEEFTLDQGKHYSDSKGCPRKESLKSQVQTAPV